MSVSTTGARVLLLCSASLGLASPGCTFTVEASESVGAGVSALLVNGASAWESSATD